ncbi:hypothetical protein HanPI659440_Chr04g0163421 [Helianthus annuus]|nr:hypothetical protein HanPI659440_Chr04g0163421 [Helianthus annuus]
MTLPQLHYITIRCFRWILRLKVFIQRIHILIFHYQHLLVALLFGGNFLFLVCAVSKYLFNATSRSASAAALSLVVRSLCSTFVESLSSPANSRPNFFSNFAFRSNTIDINRFTSLCS